MRALRLSIFLVSVAAAGCATLDAASVGRAERLGKPPFVRHFESFAVPERVVLLAPVSVDQATRRDMLDPAQAEGLAVLAAAMDARLAALDCCSLAAAPLPEKGAPWVYVGSAQGATAPPGLEQLMVDTDKVPPMVLHLDRPAGEWKTGLAGQPPADAYLWLRLALVDYPGAADGLFGKKVVLGAGHEVSRPFLRAELQPVQVLQVTAALIATDGRVLAAGAEGIHAVDTPFKAQAFGLQREIDPEGLRQVREELRRTDLPGQPLKWEAALDHLVAALLHPTTAKPPRR